MGDISEEILQGLREAVEYSKGKREGFRISLFGESPETGAEVVASWRREGVIGSRPEIKDSQAHARKLREQAEQRKKNS